MLFFSRRAALAFPLLAAGTAWAATDADNTVVMTLKNGGKVVIRLRPDWAPKHVAQIETLVKRGFYDGLVFHRVIPGFMAQTGDPTGTGSGGSDLPNIPAEFNATHFKRGIVGMARAERPGLGQFAVLHRDQGFGLPRRPVHRLRRGRVGDGRGRQDQGGHGSQQRHGDESGQDRFHEDGGFVEIGVLDMSEGNTLTLETTKGPVVIEMNPAVAPNHVAHIKKLVNEGFYDGIVFHRVIDNFMAQTGCPHGTGTGGSKYPNLKQEFNAEPHVRGTVSMARAQSPDSANSQFFICFDDARFLDRQYTVWGKVTSGMENVDKIKRGEPVRDPDKIVKATLS